MSFHCLSPSQLGRKLHPTRRKNTGPACFSTPWHCPSCPVSTYSCQAAQHVPATLLGAGYLPSHSAAHSGHTGFWGQQSANEGVKFKISTMSGGHSTTQPDWASGNASLRKGQGATTSAMKLPQAPRAAGTQKAQTPSKRQCSKSEEIEEASLGTSQTRPTGGML